MLPRLQRLTILIAVLGTQPGWAQCTPGDLPDRLDELMDDARLKATQVSAMVIDVESGKDLWSRDPDLPLNPASTQKLLTLLAVLDASSVQCEGTRAGQMHTVALVDPRQSMP